MYQIAVTEIRDKLIQHIKQTVSNSMEIIGTFYKNIGEHYNQSTIEEEYSDSPIVVIHNTQLRTYGGYEAATLYELFLDSENKLMATLNGESGEDFDEPIENICTDNLVDIMVWLKKEKFLPDSDFLNKEYITPC